MDAGARMSSLTHPITSWAEFQRLPERPETGIRYELHDGEVVVVPPPRPWHARVQKRIELELQPLAGDQGMVLVEWPYRPSPNLQYWVADIAYVPIADWDAMSREEWQVYAPPLIIEALSPSNTPVKVNRQRMTAMSAGTQEFWIVSREPRTVEVSRLDSTVQVYGAGDVIPLALFSGSINVDDIIA
jgi:Uma2 family endonuclease